MWKERFSTFHSGQSDLCGRDGVYTLKPLNRSRSCVDTYLMWRKVNYLQIVICLFFTYLQSCDLCWFPFSYHINIANAEYMKDGWRNSDGVGIR